MMNAAGISYPTAFLHECVYNNLAIAKLSATPSDLSTSDFEEVRAFALELFESR